MKQNSFLVHLCIMAEFARVGHRWSEYDWQEAPLGGLTPSTTQRRAEPSLPPQKGPTAPTPALCASISFARRLQAQL